MKLSKRLMNVASFVSEGSNIADIGTDHGYVPIYLVKKNLVKNAFALDVRKGPLERAEVHIREEGLEDRIQTRLSDGMEKLQPGEADAIIIAGMGGELIVKILSEGRRLFPSIRELILSPQSELEKVRQYLQKNDFSIIKETMVLEDGKYYTIMKAVRGSMKEQSPIELKYGRYLLDEKNPVLIQYLNEKKKKLEAIKEDLQTRPGEAVKTRLSDIGDKTDRIKEALDEML